MTASETLVVLLREALVAASAEAMHDSYCELTNAALAQRAAGPCTCALKDVDAALRASEKTTSEWLARHDAEIRKREREVWIGICATRGLKAVERDGALHIEGFIEHDARVRADARLEVRAELFAGAGKPLAAEYDEKLRKAFVEEFKPYVSHLGCCCRGLPSALRPCNCGLFDKLGPLSDREVEKRKEHKDLGPFPDTKQIERWVNRGD